MESEILTMIDERRAFEDYSARWFRDKESRTFPKDIVVKCNIHQSEILLNS
jgi:hypothetical protein